MGADGTTSVERVKQALRVDALPCELVVGGLAATIAMTCAVATASANKLSTSNRNLRVVWSSLEAREPAGVFGTVRCPVTLEGSFNYFTMAKVIHALIGRISRASIASASCTNGHATVLSASLPWHLTYFAFNGTLPRIQNEGTLATMALRIENTLAGNCLMTATAEHEAVLNANVEEGGNITTMTPEAGRQIPLIGDPTCNGSEEVLTSPARDGLVTLLGNTMVIRLFLI